MDIRSLCVCVCKFYESPVPWSLAQHARSTRTSPHKKLRWLRVRSSRAVLRGAATRNVREVGSVLKDRECVRSYNGSRNGGEMVSIEGGRGAAGRPVHRGVAGVGESSDLAVEPEQRAERGRKGAGVLGDEERDVVPLAQRVGVGTVRSTHPAVASAAVWLACPV